MPRPKQITPITPLTIHLPADRLIRLKLYLTSPTLGKVPQGAMAQFITERIDEFFARMEKPPGLKPAEDAVLAAVNKEYFGAP